jgi:outer membrane PBP1 activator LpoA protein
MLRRHILFLSAVALAAELFGGAVRAADTTLAENAAPTKPPASEPAPHIALLLPLNANTFRQPAEVVRQGFQAAAKAQPDTPPVRVYPTTDEVGNILTVYTQALAQGARVVVGPLGRNAVSTLAASELVVVPTLTLTMPEQENLAIPPQLYLFGLSIEEEARQVADMAARDGYRRPLIVAAESQLAKRMQAAFTERWQNQGRTLAETLRFSPAGDLAALRDAVQKQDADMIFLAGNVQEARTARPYLSPMLPTYATSQAFGGRAQDPRNVDLAGVRFIDMPWLLQPDHPAVMIYPRPEPPVGAELERLYALGIDALRLATQLYRDPAAVTSMTLDGVTGKLTLGRAHLFLRELVPAEFQQDSVVIIDSTP